MPPIDPNLHPAEAAQRQRAVIVRIVRYAFFILVATFTMLTILRTGTGDPLAEVVIGKWYIMVSGSFLLFGAAVAVDLLTPNKKISTIAGVLVGILAGLLATLAIGFIIDLLIESWVESKPGLDALKPVITSIKVLVGLAMSYLGVTTVLQTQDDFRLVIPYVEFAKQLRGTRPMLLDTSALIDGRIADIAQTGILQAPLVVARFVIGELQQLADSTDAMKRSKGRRGLEIIARLQRLPRLDVTIDETVVPGKAVDQMLVELARSMSAIVVTTDVGLAKVAAIQAVPVLNLHDLANALKSALVPGEPVTLKLIRHGEQATQGVGYLADGTMVVVEDGAPSIGQSVTATVTSSLQTSAGRLIFAKIGEDSPSQIVMIEPPVTEPAPQQPLVEKQAAVEEAPPRTPYPPNPSRTMRTGTPRNPRR